MEIAGYRLDRQIGEGGMSEVYLAEQLSLNRQVAIKFLSEQLLNHPTAKKLFENESLIVARLNHPKIIHVIDKGVTQSGKPYFVMEYVAGTTLHDVVQEQSVSATQKLNYIIQICRGLSFAHRNGIVHRDIKPANIIIDEENNARILDFGIAALFADERFNATGSDKVLGTDRYMAPEVKTSAYNASILSDIYALGALMLEVFSEDFTQPLTLTTLEKADIPKPIKPIIAQCLADKPEQRPTAAAVIEKQCLHIIKGAHLAASQKQAAEKDVAALNKNFTLLEVFNENEFGSVYLYERKNSSELMVIKKRINDTSGLKEAKLLASLKHSNIINILGTASNQRAFIVVMEYLDGGSLADRLIQPFSLEDFYPIAEKLLEALEFAHKNRIIHGNIRPSNILFSQQNDVKLSDFGYREHYLQDEQPSNWYLPQKPEPAANTLDLFAIGAVFYHMLTGAPIAWKNGQITWTEEYSKLPKDLQQLLLKLLALDPDYRPASSSEALAQLKQLRNSPGNARRIRPRRALFSNYQKPAALGFWGVLNRVYWTIVFAAVFTYSQIYWFLPDVKQEIHKILKELLLWWASNL
ncbi:protein kinase domain-containing protein [Pleionea litopenaei]|uniref:Protein kinase n=1 Tax=Pleionea litopenaei TaxID=3070815 RepID=A0AA51RSQ3_9GAMM|nr:protein kinase [Pleionea sp. HL-JVS1]WMS86911.1 protein kinase [Pleionea sp. HL-JVS1]